MGSTVVATLMPIFVTRGPILSPGGGSSVVRTASRPRSRSCFLCVLSFLFSATSALKVYALANPPTAIGVRVIVNKIVAPATSNNPAIPNAQL